MTNPLFGSRYAVNSHSREEILEALESGSLTPETLKIALKLPEAEEKLLEMVSQSKSVFRDGIRGIEEFIPKSIKQYIVSNEPIATQFENIKNNATRSLYRKNWRKFCWEKPVGNDYFQLLEEFKQSAEWSEQNGWLTWGWLGHGYRAFGLQRDSEKIHDIHVSQFHERDTIFPLSSQTSFIEDASSVYALLKEEPIDTIHFGKNPDCKNLDLVNKAPRGVWHDKGSSSTAYKYIEKRRPGTTSRTHRFALCSACARQAKNEKENWNTWSFFSEEQEQQVRDQTKDKMIECILKDKTWQQTCLESDKANTESIKNIFAENLVEQYQKDPVKTWNYLIGEQSNVVIDFGVAQELIADYDPYSRENLILNAQRIAKRY